MREIPHAAGESAEFRDDIAKNRFWEKVPSPIPQPPAMAPDKAASGT